MAETEVKPRESQPMGRRLSVRFARMTRAFLHLVAQSRAEAPGDWEMSINRFAAGVMVGVFNFAWLRGHLGGGLALMIVAALYLVMGFVVLAHCIVAPGRVLLRRSAAMSIDFVAACYELHAGGAHTAWLYPIYLWVIFGNGFRFGERFLIIATAISAASFTLTVLITPFWRNQPSLTAGLLVGMIVVPLYSITLIRKLSEARRRAEVASDAKSLFLASVSHELRTPLNAIVGTGALLEASSQDGEQQEMSRTIMTAARALLSLIEGILDLSRIEAGKMPAVANDFDLAELLGQIQRMMMPQAQAKDLALTLHVSARTPMRLHGDDRRLREILLNLISNAIKFTADGGVAIAADMISDEVAGDRFRFEVSDSGIGIQRDALDRIFETFEQANSQILNNYGGTGLGLAITRKLVLLLGGTIGVDSVIGQGSTFWFELPFTSERLPIAQTERFQELQAILLSRQPGSVAALVTRLSDWRVPIRAATKAESMALGAIYDPETMLGVLSLLPRGSDRSANPDSSLVKLLPLPSHGLTRNPKDRPFVSALGAAFSDEELMSVLSVVLATQSGRAAAVPEIVPSALENPGLRILVADDNRMNQLVMGKILSKAGHDVKVVGDGGAALDALLDEEFDAAIMDVNMPVMDGVQVVQTFRVGTIGDAPLPILGLSADASAETRDRCLAAGMNASITKPIEPAALLAAIDEVVSRIRPKTVKPPETQGQVTQISSHPRFNEISTPSFDRKMINHLYDLAGPEFVQEVIDNYLTESRESVEALRQAQQAADVEGFRFSAHALRSGAANLGIMRLFDLCHEMETISARDLRDMGTAHLRRLTAELAVVEDALRHWETKGMAQQ